jgi:hypothetical protein
MVDNHDPHDKRKHFEAKLEIRSRYRVRFAGATNLVAGDDFAHAGDANRFAWSDLLSTGARRSWRKAFFNLEVQNHEGEC